MFGRRFFGARYYAPRYFGDGGLPPEPGDEIMPVRMMMGYGH